jgi:hypothetical protein
LPDGLQKMSLNELKAKVVDAFPLWRERPKLWESFLGLLEQEAACCNLADFGTDTWTVV